MQWIYLLLPLQINEKTPKPALTETQFGIPTVLS